MKSCNFVVQNTVGSISLYQAELLKTYLEKFAAIWVERCQKGRIFVSALPKNHTNEAEERKTRKGEGKERKRSGKRNVCTRCFCIDFFVFERKNYLTVTAVTFAKMFLVIQKYSCSNVGNRRWQLLPHNLETGHKKADIPRIRHWFPGEMTSEKRAQKFHTDDVSLHTSGYYSLKKISLAAWPIRSTSQVWIVTRHQCGISAVVAQISFRGETSGGVAKCQLFCSGYEDGRQKTFPVGLFCLVLETAYLICFSLISKTEKPSVKKIHGIVGVIFLFFIFYFFIFFPN